MVGRAGIRETVRAGDWWTYKLVPLLAVFYMTALSAGVSLWDRLPEIGLLLAGLAAGAAFVSLLNDLCDIGSDAAAGKANRLAGRSRALAVGAIGCCVLLGAGIALLLPRDPIALAAYGCAWCAFACYSIRPLRLKARGAWGLSADAAGSSLFPAILAARLAGGEDPVWLGLVALWSFAFGMRGIAWHQIRDEAADRRARVWTYVVRRGRRTTVRLVQILLVPVEMGALAGLLIFTQSIAPAVAVTLYAAVVALHHDNFLERPTFIVPRGRSLMLGLGFYDLLLPLAILSALAVRHTPDAAVLAAHLILFPGPLLGFVGDARAIWRCHRARVVERAEQRAMACEKPKPL